MSLFETVQSDRLKSKRRRDSVASKILTVLVGELQTVSIRLGQDVTDEMVIKTIKKFITNNNETIRWLDNVASGGILKSENDILDIYLPEQLTEDELIGIIHEQNPTNIGQAMRFLKDNYLGRYDGHMASSVIKKALQD